MKGVTAVHMDKVTEAIAHFIGLFQTTIESGRLRKDYQDFKIAQRAAEEQPDLDDAIAVFRPAYAFGESEPGLRYIPPSSEIVRASADSEVAYLPPAVPNSAGLPPMSAPGIKPPMAQSSQSVSMTIEPPGQIALRIDQKNILSDSDYVGVGGHGGLFHAISGATQMAALETLLHDALKVDPLGELVAPGTGEEIGIFVENAAALLAAAPEQAADDADPGTTWESFAVGSDVLQGIWVDGETAEETPDLQDHLPEGSPLAKAEEEEAGPAGGNRNINGGGTSASGESAKGEGLVVPEASVELDAGSNTLANSAVLANKAMFGSVFATSGDHIEINAIVQVNAWSDADAVGETLADWPSASEVTEAFNIAQFHRVDPSADAKPVSGESMQFPDFWVVTEVIGDLIFTNWMEQVNFVIDNDVHVMASSGVTTTVTTGANIAINDISIDELGHYYDLVLVGGKIYDANLISQVNLLLDNDLIGAVDGFSTTGDASVSTGGNLLWNQASIANVGGADRFAPLNEAYRDTLASFASGHGKLADGVLGDDAFLGLSGLRVLYVSGSIYDLQYISQMNVLGDADEVALAMHTAAAGRDADWSVVTGSNALINAAAIVDLDANSKSYVGGEQYSYELLIQTDIIKTDPLVASGNADALVNEAVAFLGDDVADSGDAGGFSGSDGSGAVHPAHNDVMLAVLS